MTVPARDLVRVFGRIGLLSFGGPAAQIALMHRELVETRNWLTEAQFLRALSFCMLLPGPEAMQLATYAGWRQRGIPGGLIAGGLFVIPGACVILALALAYGTYGDMPLVQAVFVGVQATVVVIVIAALRKVMSKALNGPRDLLIAAAAFVALFAFGVPFPIVILLAGLTGTAFGHGQAEVSAQLDLTQSLRILAVGLVIWFVPLLLVWASGARFLTEIGLFFSQLAVVTFGGAYAVLAFMTQTVVADYGWIETPQMMDALGLAETTPGPLILVTQFVAMIAGLAKGGVMLALAAGALTLWVTFVPCFIWIFAGAPLIDWLAGQPRLQAALQGITSAVVGVIANLALWFALHVFFGSITTSSIGPVVVTWPIWSTVAWAPITLAIFAAVLLLWRRWDMLTVLAFTAALALLGYLTGLV